MSLHVNRRHERMQRPADRLAADDSARTRRFREECAPSPLFPGYAAVIEALREASASRREVVKKQGMDGTRPSREARVDAACPPKLPAKRG